MASFRILGPIEAWAGERRLPLSGPRQLALLAFLLLHANRATSSDALIDAVWGPDRTGAGKRLQVAIGRLRRILEPMDVGGETVLRTVGGGYLLTVAADQLDADVFQRRVRDGRDALDGGDPARATELLHEALELWRGPSLAEVAFEDFAQGEIRRLEELRLVALEARVDADLRLGRHAVLIGELEALLADQPTRESLAGQLMLAMYRCGRQREALDVYQRTRAQLAGELGLEVGPALRALQTQILNQDASLMLNQDPTVEGALPDKSGRPTSLSPSRVDPRRLFVGHDRELAALEGVLEQALAGRGGVVLLTGEPGIGKSRLADELTSVARLRGARVLWGRCWESGGAPVYWPWIQALRTYLRDCGQDPLSAQLGAGAGEVARILPELRELLPDVPDVEQVESDSARFRLFDAVTTFVCRAAAKQPLVIVLDDLHAADEASLLLLVFLAQAIDNARVLLVGAYRKTDVTADHLLRETISDLSREKNCLRLNIGCLTLEDTSHFVELTAGAVPLPRLSREIHQASGGNPLLLTELVRLLATEGRLHELDAREDLVIPYGVGDVIARRVARLSASCRQTLVAASVMGREFDPIVIGEVRGVAAETLAAQCEEASAARLVEEAPGRQRRLRFSHTLIRDTFYREVERADRMRLHGIIGDALEQRFADNREPPLAELAHHFLEAAPAGWADKAIHYARRAAESAAGALAYEEAARLYGLALDTAEDSDLGDDRSQAEVVVALAEQLVRGGDLDRARAGLSERIRQVERGRHADLSARATIARCMMDMFRSARCDEDAIERAIAFFQARGDAANEARAWWALSWMRGETGQIVTMGEAAQRSLDCARRAGDHAQASQALHLLPYSLAYGPANADEVIPKLRRHRAEAGTKQTEALVLGYLGIVEAMRAHFAEARHAADESRKILASLRNLLDVARSDLFRRTEIERWAGNLPAAERFAQDGCTIMEHHAATGLLASAPCILAEVLIAQGRLDEARDLVARATVNVIDEDIDARYRQARARARIELATGSLETAEINARAALELVLCTQVPHEQSDTFFVLAQVLQATARTADAQHAARQSLTLAESKGHVMYAHRARELLATLEGARIAKRRVS